VPSPSHVAPRGEGLPGHGREVITQ
jgi:hypothetical protein